MSPGGLGHNDLGGVGHEPRRPRAKENAWEIKVNMELTHGGGDDGKRCRTTSGVQNGPQANYEPEPGLS